MPLLLSDWVNSAYIVIGYLFKWMFCTLLVSVTLSCLPSTLICSVITFFSANIRHLSSPYQASLAHHICTDPLDSQFYPFPFMHFRLPSPASLFYYLWNQSNKSTVNWLKIVIIFHDNNDENEVDCLHNRESFRLHFSRTSTGKKAQLHSGIVYSASQ